MIPTNVNASTRRFLLIAPLIVFPFSCLIFALLGGGAARFGNPVGMGLNPQLPRAHFDPRKALLDKMRVYAQADHDSTRKQLFRRQDPYRPDTTATKKASLPAPVIVADHRADQLLTQLETLRRSLHPVKPAWHETRPAFLPTAHVRNVRDTMSKVADSVLDRVNTVLDKVIRIQHPEDRSLQNNPTPHTHIDAILPADTTANTIAAVIPSDQTLTAGATIALRIIDSIRVNKQVMPAGQLVYGVVSLNNDRMLVRITSLRADRALYNTDLQVYDLDGIAGIHIPGVLGRDVAKQSADQGVNSVNLLPVDATIGAQAASAGIVAAKSFLGHKVRQVRVGIRAGYQVLLRSAREDHPANFINSTYPVSLPRPAGFDPAGPILKHAATQGVELALYSLRLEGDYLWFGLQWTNHSAITYVPAYLRWFIRDKRVFRRTAMQEEAVDPVSPQDLPIIESDSTKQTFTPFHPFALPKGKELVLEAGEKQGGRTLLLVIEEKLWSKIKKQAQ